MAYIKKSKTIAETEKTEDFKNKVKWIEWYPNFINFLSAIPVRSGVPISYICRPINVIIHATYGDFINDYVDRSNLTRQVYETNASKFHIYIVRFASVNPAAYMGITRSPLPQNNCKLPLPFLMFINQFFS